MPDPLLPDLPVAPAVSAESAAYQTYQLHLVQREIFNQNTILIDRERQLCDMIQAQSQAQAEASIRSDFFGHAVAFACAFAVGLMTWRMVVLGKNQRSLW